MSNVLEKIQNVKIELAKRELKKTGKGYGYDYYELGDFLPSILELCNLQKLFTKITFTNEEATLIIIDTETKEPLNELNCQVYTSPMRNLELAKANAIQSLGGVETYQRRYLYMAAFDIVEADMFDGQKEVKSKKTKENKESSNKIDKCKHYFMSLTDVKEKQKVIEYLSEKGYKSFAELQAKNVVDDIDSFIEHFKLETQEETK